MRKLFAMLTVVALATGMTACSDDDGTETPKDPTTTNFNLRARGGNVMVTLTTSDYTIDIPAADADWIGLSEQSQGEVVVLSVKPNTTGAERSTTVTLAEKTTGTTLAYMNIKQSENSLYSGDFLIEESFFTSCPLPATGKVDKAHGDQYIKIRNNTDQDLYADGLLIITSSKITSVQNISFNEGEDPRPNYCIVDEILCIPGDGDDVLVKAGESLLICNNAQNHKATNPNSFDLTSADFEWYNESTVESMLDIDNPEVDNLDIWYTYTKSVIMLDAAGKRSCALAIPPIGMTRDRFLADYAFTGSYIFHSPNGKDHDMTFKNCFKVPNSWIVDAVNLGVSSEYLTNPWDTELDAGYTYACETSSDQTSYGLSVRRKVAADGKLVDTNNSTNDFTPRATPSLSEIQ